MKILILNGLDPRKNFDPGGVRTYGLNLVKITELLGHYIEFYGTNSIKSLISLNRNVYSGFDIVLINFSIYDPGFLKLIYELLRLKNKKIIVQCHGGNFSTLKLKMLYKVLFKRLLNRKVSLFLVLNVKQKQSLKKYFIDSEDKIWQIPNYIENSFNIQEKNYDGKLKFFYIGRIVEKKGIFDFAEAFMEIKSHDIEFNIVGTGPDEDRLLEFTQRDKRIIFYGKKFGEEKEKLFKENHVFVFLTSYPEGFPISVLEALNYGMVVLSSKFPNSNKLVINDYNGFVININKEEIKEKILTLMNNKKLIKRFGINSKHILNENFALETCGTDQYKRIFSFLTNS